MKPLRIEMTDELIRAYGLDKRMTRMEIEEEFIENVDFTIFHADDYIDVLKNCTPENKELYSD
jgi:acetoin utilization deacetylase AcuC-like enzyme